MDRSKALLFSAMLVFLAAKSAEASISCYTCSSRNGSDVNCEDPFHPAFSTYSTECMVPKKGHIGKFPANFCIKVIGVSYETGEKIVIRACNLENMENQCGNFRLENSEFHKDTLRGCILTCNYDGCNKSTRISTSATSLVLTAAVVLVARFTGIMT